jgi:hypothetical protein
VRFSSGQEGRCRPLAGFKDDEWAARITDISRGGIALMVNRRFEIGTVLHIQVPEKGGPRYLLVRVVRQQARPARKWLLGCKFAAPLSDDEVKALI